MEEEDKLQIQIDFLNLAIGLAKAPRTLEGRSRLDSNFLRKYISVVHDRDNVDMARFNGPNNVPRRVEDGEVRQYFLEQIRNLVEDYNASQGYDREMFRIHLLRLRNLKARLVFSLERNDNFQATPFQWQGLAPFTQDPVYTNDVGSVVTGISDLSY